jgi:hypothetical protein
MHECEAASLGGKGFIHTHLMSSSAPASAKINTELRKIMARTGVRLKIMPFDRTNSAGSSYPLKAGSIKRRSTQGGFEGEGAMMKYKKEKVKELEKEKELEMEKKELEMEEKELEMEEKEMEMGMKLEKEEEEEENTSGL